VAAAEAAAVEDSAAPIEQIEKKIHKRTKKATIIEDTSVPQALPVAAKKAPRKKTEKTEKTSTAAAAAETGASESDKKKTKKKPAADD